jgi:antitoxin (DNA-binding transcriptional repressor) of toxin-antitoxin stability system
MMRTVGIFEAKTKLSELIEAVKRGEEIRITQRGKPVARLVVDNEVVLFPADAAVVVKAGTSDIFSDIRASMRARGISFTAEDIIAWKNEGRE